MYNLLQILNRFLLLFWVVSYRIILFLNENVRKKYIYLFLINKIKIN